MSLRMPRSSNWARTGKKRMKSVESREPHGIRNTAIRWLGEREGKTDGDKLRRAADASKVSGMEAVTPWRRSLFSSFVPYVERKKIK
jgi:hypothetical protein